MEKYLISVDLDDTLLTSEKLITKETIEYVQELVKKGHHFIINTGRPHQGAIQFLKMLGIHEPMIVNNGGAIVYFDDNYEKVIDYHLFPIGIKTFIAFHKRVKPYLHCGTTTSLFDFYSYDFNKTPFWVVHKSNDVKLHECDISTHLNTTPISGGFDVKAEFENEFEKVLKQKRFQNLQVTRWGHYDGIVPYDISSKKASKGNAMLYLAKKYHIKKENTISFGDQLNDLSMINAAGYGVAMINSRDEVKEKAKYISEFDFNNNGVIEFIKKVIKE